MFGNIRKRIMIFSGNRKNLINKFWEELKS